MDTPFLEDAERGSYERFKGRIHFLPHIYNLLYHYDCEIKLVNQAMDNAFKRRKIDMIFKRKEEKYVYLLELIEVSISPL